jgi:hypothetical protein
MESFKAKFFHSVYFSAWHWGYPRKHVLVPSQVRVYKQRQVYKHRGSRNLISGKVTFLCRVMWSTGSK